MWSTMGKPTHTSQVKHKRHTHSTRAHPFRSQTLKIDIVGRCRDGVDVLPLKSRTVRGSPSVNKVLASQVWDEKQFPECQIFAILSQEGLSRLCDWVHSRWSSIRFLILRGPSQCRNVMLGSVLILLINGADMRHWMAHSSTHFLCNWLPTLWRAEMQLRRSQVLLQGIDGSTDELTSKMEQVE